MQPAPSEVSQTATSIESLPEPTRTFQHGLSPTDELASAGFSSAEVVRVSSTSADDADNASVTSTSTHRGRRFDTRRLSRSESSSQESSPGSRIDEYEKAHVTPRKPMDGMVFKIVPMAAGKQNRVSVLDFPNGMKYVDIVVIYTNKNQRSLLISFRTYLQRRYR